MHALVTQIRNKQKNNNIISEENALAENIGKA